MFAASCGELVHRIVAETEALIRGRLSSMILEPEV